MLPYPHVRKSWCGGNLNSSRGRETSNLIATSDRGHRVSHIVQTTEPASQPRTIWTFDKTYSYRAGWRKKKFSFSRKVTQGGRIQDVHNCVFFCFSSVFFFSQEKTIKLFHCVSHKWSWEDDFRLLSTSFYAMASFDSSPHGSRMLAMWLFTPSQDEIKSAHSFFSLSSISGGHIAEPEWCKK